MFKQNLNTAGYPEIEKQILKFWEQNKVFEKSITSRPENKPFTFYEGPPTANGKPGIHHVISRTLKDLVCRYKTMQGFRVERKAGWDTHGLPVEIEVEKIPFSSTTCCQSKALTNFAIRTLQCDKSA